MDIKENLFDLSDEDIETSQMIYDGKIIKCLVAPYHSYAQLEKIVPFTKTTYLFPERELSSDKARGLISMIVKNPSNEEFRIVTAETSIIIDMVDCCVRVLTEGGNVLPSPCKTFLANIHDIRYDLLENKDHQLGEQEKTESVKRVNALIERVEKAKDLNIVQFAALLKEIEMIGEPVIERKLKEMAHGNRQH